MKKAGRIIGIIVVVLIVGAIVVAAIWYSKAMGAVSSESDAVQITIGEGSTLTGIGNILYENGLISSELAFKVYTKLNSVNNIMAGKYELNKNMTMSQLVEVLEAGPDLSKYEINITFNEGWNMRKIAKAIAEKTTNTEDAVFEKVADKEYLNKVIEKYWFVTDEILDEQIYYPLEGYLYPNTYTFTDKNVTVEEIFEKMLDEMDKQLTEIKSDLENSEYASVHKILTLASVIELEAPNAEDRAGVSSVFYNRLKSGMALGSDVTTYYGIQVDMSERDLKQSEINARNGYNTRNDELAGKLPVGPICSPSISSIKATIDPDPSEYYFFVSDSNGRLYFSKTYSEHLQTIQKLQSGNLWYEY